MVVLVRCRCSGWRRRRWSTGLVVTKSKAEKDSNKPKHPQSAVLVLMDSFRKDSNIKLVSMVGKGGGEKWNYLESC
ncbi:HMG1/2-like protein [Aegilops tauschii subsp. strangulata]|uniref:HMG1/2-like protein n=1 Tax=Aegilops tauschii subsp. strangulata TaxID=200361 RepID=UPI003CC8B79B